MRLSLPEFARIRLKSRNSDGFWTAPAPCRLNGAKLRRILDHPTRRKRLHPVVEAALPPRGSVALQARGSVALSAHATDRIGAGNHLLSRQPPGSSRASPGHNHRVRGTLYPESPGSSRASPGHNHPLGQATTYWGRKIAYPNAQFPTPMPGAGARQSPPHSSARLAAPTGEHPGRSHWLSARTGPPPPPPCRLGLGALDERTVE